MKITLQVAYKIDDVEKKFIVCRHFKKPDFFLLFFLLHMSQLNQQDYLCKSRFNHLKYLSG